MGTRRRAGGEFALVNDFLGYLSDRNYSPRTVRAYLFDPLHFARWLSAEGLALDEVDGDVLLRYLAACRSRCCRIRSVATSTDP